MTDQDPERGAIGDQRENQREDGLVVEPGGEPNLALRGQDLPPQGEEGGRR